jgi:hypothetical protein
VPRVPEPIFGKATTVDDVRRCFACDVALLDGRDVWIEGPMPGHWLTEAERETLAAFMGRVVPTTPVVIKKRHSTIRKEDATPSQQEAAGLVAFAILISSRIETPAEALELAINLVKLRDKAALNRRRYKLLESDSTLSLRRRLRTLQTHLDGTGRLKIEIDDAGMVALTFGVNSLRL